MLLMPKWPKIQVQRWMKQHTKEQKTVDLYKKSLEALNWRWSQSDLIHCPARLRKEDVLLNPEDFIPIDIHATWKHSMILVRSKLLGFSLLFLEWKGTLDLDARLTRRPQIGFTVSSRLLGSYFSPFEFDA